MKTKFKVALSPGHTPDRPGANHNGITEYGLSCAVIGDLAFRLDKLGHEAWVVGADSNTDQVDRINKMYPDFGLELHFNGHIDHEMNGTEVLYSGSTKGSLLAANIQTDLIGVLKTKDRGIKIGYYRQNPEKPIIEIIRKTICPFVVIEPLFLTNSSDRNKIEIPLISVGILNGILAYWEGGS